MQTLANLFIMSGLLNKEQVRNIFETQKETGDTFIKTMVDLGYSTEDKVAKFLAKYFKTEFVKIDGEEIPIPVLNLVSEELAIKHRLIPYKKVGSMLFLAMINPANLNAIDDVKFKTGLDVIPVVTTETSLNKSLGKYREAQTQISEFEEDDDLDLDLDLEEEDMDLDLDLGDELGFDDDLELVGEFDSKVTDIGDAGSAENKPVIKLVNYIFT